MRTVAILFTLVFTIPNMLFMIGVTTSYWEITSYWVIAPISLIGISIPIVYVIRRNKFRKKEVKRLQERFAELGVKKSLDSLLKLDYLLDANASLEEHNHVTHCKAVFTGEEFEELLLTIHSPLSLGYKRILFRQRFALTLLPIAVNLQKLIVYQMGLKKALNMILRKEKGEELSPRELKKKQELMDELKRTENKVNQFAYLSKNLYDEFVLNLNQYGLMEEEEFFEAVTSKSSVGKPPFNKNMSSSTIQSSRMNSTKKSL